MFEHMEISESINECVVETSYKIYTRGDVNRAGHIRKMGGESTSSNTYSEMSESADKCRKIHVDHPKDISKHTCLIHGPMNLSVE